MNKADYEKIAKLAAGGALVAFGLWRRSLFGLVVGGMGGLLIQRTLAATGEAGPEAEALAREENTDGEVFAVKEGAAEPTHDVHVADLDIEADTLDGVHKA